jgi:hypothetical protein
MVWFFPLEVRFLPCRRNISVRLFVLVSNPMPDKTAQQTKWVWCGEAAGAASNRYADFRKPFSAAAGVERWLLRVSVDSNFAAWVNGVFVGCGQFGDFPDQRTFSAIDLTPHVRAGENVLAIQVHYCGVDHSSYIAGEAGLWFEIERDGAVAACSDEATLARESPGYVAEGTSRVTVQRGFGFHYRALDDDAWRGLGYVCGDDWRAAVVTGCRQTPRARPVAMLETNERVAGAVIAQGLIKHGAGENLSEKMQRAYLSARHPWELFEGHVAGSEPIRGTVSLGPGRLAGADGFYVVYDLGREVCGFVDLHLAGPTGCVIDLVVGEHLDDLRVRASVGGRGFACRYVTCEGGQGFTHWHHRFAGRYIQLHITGLTGGLTLERVGLVAAAYPVREVGRYSEADGLANKLWRTAGRTLRLCMFEHYEDCPWREQALYANDARNQMLSGFYLFNDYDFARASLELLGRSVGGDGYLGLCAPMRSAFTIPGFTMIWLLALSDYHLYSGDTAYIRGALPQVKRMLGRLAATLVDGLLPCPTGERYWHFYDWAPGLDGVDGAGGPGFLPEGARRFDAPLNGLWLMAMNAVAGVARFSEDAELTAHCSSLAAAGAAAAHGMFYDGALGVYRTYAGMEAAPHYAELTQALMVLAGVGDERLRGQLRRRLAEPDGELVSATLSQSLYTFEAVLQEDALAGAVRSAIMRRWSPMLFAGATSFWEMERGGWDFNHAGSLCHGWSGIPAYFFGVYGLGVRPIEPGFGRVRIKPVFDIDRVEGVVPTPAGEIALTLRREGGRYAAQVEAPQAVAVEADARRVSSVNGKRVR